MKSKLLSKYVYNTHKAHCSVWKNQLFTALLRILKSFTLSYTQTLSILKKIFLFTM